MLRGNGSGEKIMARGGWDGQGVNYHSEEVSDQEKMGKEPIRSGIRRSWMSFVRPVQEGGRGGYKEGQPDSLSEGLDSFSSKV